MALINVMEVDNGKVIAAGGTGGGGGSKDYLPGYNIDIIGDTIQSKDFVGTQDEWDSLTSAQKAKYDQINITDDFDEPVQKPGHTILNTSGTAMPQRTNLKASGFNVSDDSTNDTTIISEVPYTAGRGVEISNKEVSVDDKIKTTFTGTQNDWDSLTDAQKAEYEIVNLTDDIAGGNLLVVDAVEDGNMNPVTSNAVYDAIGQGYILVEDNYFTYSVDATVGATKTYREFLNECNAEFISKFQTLANNEVMEIVGIQATGNSMAINGINIIRRLYENSTTGLTINTVGSVMDASTPAMKVAQIRFHSTTSRFYITVTTASGSSLTVNDSATIGSAYEMQIYYRKYRRTTT